MKRILLILVGALTIPILMTGCSKNVASNEYVEIEGYKGIEVEKPTEISEVTDTDVDNYINMICEQNSVEVTERAIELGDVVNINYVGRVDESEFEGGSAENFTLEVGAGQFLTGFDEGIVGHSVGETFEWSGILPENYANNPELSGRDVIYTVTVNSITRPADLTDEFVKTVSESSKTVEEYRKEVKQLLEENALLDYDVVLQQSVWEAVLEKAEVKKYPEAEVKKSSDSLIQQYKDAAMNAGVEYEVFIQEQMGFSVEEFENQVEEAAKADIKQRLVAEVISDKEKLIPDADDLEEEYQKLAEQYGYQDVDILKETVGEEGLKSIVIQNIVKEWLVDNCVQVSE